MSLDVYFFVYLDEINVSVTCHKVQAIIEGVIEVNIKLEMKGPVTYHTDSLKVSFIMFYLNMVDYFVFFPQIIKPKMCFQSCGKSVGVSFPYLGIFSPANTGSRYIFRC